MREPTRISWRMLTGNKFLQGLMPEMFSKEGCLKAKRLRKTGDLEASYFEIMYDRDYALQVIARSIIARLESMGKEKVHALIDEAWLVHEANKYATLKR